MLLAATSLLLTAGCETVRFEMQAPATDAGRACVTQCAAIMESCRGNELRRVRIALDACERRAESTVHLCLADADSADKKRICELNRPHCWAAEAVGPCEGNYRGCFLQCGGTVDKVVTDR